MSNEPDLGEQALDKVAEVAISSQLDEAENVEVDIRTDAGKLVQGKLESVSVTGEGLVLKPDLRVESLEIHTNTVAIDPLKAIAGELKLSETLNAQTRVVMTEIDLNRALASEDLKQKMQNLKVWHDSSEVIICVERFCLTLQANQKVYSNACLYFPQTNDRKEVKAVFTPFVKADGYRIGLEVFSAEVGGLTLSLLQSLINQLAELLDLRNLQIGGCPLQIQSLDVREGELWLQAAATIPAVDNE